MLSLQARYCIRWRSIFSYLPRGTAHQRHYVCFQGFGTGGKILHFRLTPLMLMTTLSGLTLFTYAAENRWDASAVEVRQNLYFAGISLETKRLSTRLIQISWRNLKKARQLRKRPLKIGSRGVTSLKIRRASQK